MDVIAEKIEALPLPTPDMSGDDLFKLGMMYSSGQGGAPAELGLQADHVIAIAVDASGDRAKCVLVHDSFQTARASAPG